MEQKNKIENFYGWVVAPVKLCNNCPNNEDCYKIDVPGIGQLCLVRASGALRELEGKYEALQDESSTMSKEMTDLRSKAKMLESSNKHMEAELERVRNANQSLSDLNDERLNQIQRLKSRGFWARMFNRY